MKNKMEPLHNKGLCTMELFLVNFSHKNEKGIKNYKVSISDICKCLCTLSEATVGYVSDVFQLTGKDPKILSGNQPTSHESGF